MKGHPTIYWVLVADGGKARIFEFRKKPADFREVQTLASEARHKRNRDMVSDGSGRSFHVQGPASHSKQPRSEPRELVEQEFSRVLVDRLETAASMKAFDRLMIFADPKTLGRMRPQMSSLLKDRIIDEVHLDLVGMPLEAMRKRIWTHLGWVD